MRRRLFKYCKLLWKLINSFSLRESYAIKKKENKQLFSEVEAYWYTFQFATAQKTKLRSKHLQKTRGISCIFQMFQVSGYVFLPWENCKFKISFVTSCGVRLNRHVRNTPKATMWNRNGTGITIVRPHDVSDSGTSSPARLCPWSEHQAEIHRWGCQPPHLTQSLNSAQISQLKQAWHSELQGSFVSDRLHRESRWILDFFNFCRQWVTDSRSRVFLWIWRNLILFIYLRYSCVQYYGLTIVIYCFFKCQLLVVSMAFLALLCVTCSIF